MRRFVTYAFCLLLAGSWIALPAATGIGMVNASGTFQVDHARVVGNATLFDGTVVETGGTAGDLRLNTGARMQLASESRGRVFQDRLVLERGVGQLQGTGYRIEARTLRIVADEPLTSARVALSGSTRVQVAALNGRLHVTNARGVLVANLAAGNAIEFEPQGNTADSTTKMTGTLRKKGGTFFLTDNTTNVTVELRGADLASKVGKLVEITGQVQANATAAAGATQVIAVQTVTLAHVAGAAGAGAASAAGATSAGIGAGTVAIVGGVAVAGTVAGLGITGSLPGQGEDTQQNSSR